MAKRPPLKPRRSPSRDLLHQISDDMAWLVRDYCERCRMAPCVCPHHSDEKRTD